MAALKERLLKTLEELDEEDLKRFQWYLCQGEPSAGLPSIPRSRMESADRPGTVDHMVQTHGSDGALKITLDLLGKIRRKDLVEPLVNKSIPKVPGSWRVVNFGNKDTLLNRVKEFHLQNEDVKHVRILLYGATASGKSSFINSVNNIFRGRMTYDAAVYDWHGGDFTSHYQTYKIQKGNTQTFLPVVFSDTMGLGTVREEDILSALKGHVKDGYEFKPASPISDKDPHYNHHPTPDDKAHVLVCVIDVKQLTFVNDEIIKKIQHITVRARNMGVPQICIITKIDEVCPLVNEDLKNVYRSRVLKEKMENFQAETVQEIPLSCFFPVKNYHDEIDLDDVVDVLILKALQHMVNLGEDFINKTF